MHNGCYGPSGVTDHRIMEILEREKNQAKQKAADIEEELGKTRRNHDGIKQDLLAKQIQLEAVIAKQERVIQDHQAESKRQETVIQDLHAKQKQLEEVIAKQEQAIQNRQAEVKRQETVIQDLRTEQKRLEGIIQNNQAELKQQEQIIQDRLTEQKRLEEIIEEQKREKEKRRIDLDLTDIFKAAERRRRKCEGR